MDDNDTSSKLLEEHPALHAMMAELEHRLPEAASPVMLFVADLVEGRFLQFNDAVCEVLGHTRREILESSFIDRVHPEDHAKTIREMQRLVAGRQTAKFRNRHLGADGTYRIFEWTAIADPDRELCYAAAVVVSG